MSAIGSLLIVGGGAALLVHARRRRRLDASLATLTASDGSLERRRDLWQRLHALPTAFEGRSATRVRMLAAVAGACVGAWIGGVPGAAIGGLAPLGALRSIERRRRARRSLLLERQLAELVEACALAVRGGASVSQAMMIAAHEVEEPICELAMRIVEQQRLGASFSSALQGFSDTIGTEDARLFVMVMTIHHRSGGSVLGPLEQVASTIRHRLAVRRELRALTAQGRISGTVLGVLPVAFFAVLAVTSHHELMPVYRSPAGASMIVGGFVLEGLAYLWIRRLLRVEP